MQNKYLKDLRKSRGLTLRDVERITEGKVSNAYLSQLENGSVNNPSVLLLYWISSAYAVDFVELARKGGFIPDISSKPIGENKPEKIKRTVEHASQPHGFDDNGLGDCTICAEDWDHPLHTVARQEGHIMAAPEDILSAPDEVFSGLVIKRKGNIPDVVVQEASNTTVYYYYEGALECIFSKSRADFFDTFKSKYGLIRQSTYTSKLVEN